MAGIGLMLCKKGNEMHYCNPDTADYWASEGWTVFELQPQRVAGAEEIHATGPQETVVVEPAIVNELPTPDSITIRRATANG